MPRQDGETKQQAEQVGQRHPFLQQVLAQAGQASNAMNAGETEFVERDRGQTGKRHRQRVMVK